MTSKIFWACVGILTPIITIGLAAMFWKWFETQRELVKKAWGKKN